MAFRQLGMGQSGRWRAPVFGLGLLIVTLGAGAAAQGPTSGGAPPAAAAPPAAPPQPAASTPPPAAAPAPTAPAPPAPAPAAASAPGPASAAAAPAIRGTAPIDSERLVSRGRRDTADAPGERLPIGTPIGQVVERREGALVLEKNGWDHVERGMRVGFNDARGDEYAVGRVSKVNNQTFHVTVGMNEEVPVGEVGYLTGHDVTGSLEVPPPAAYPLAFALVLRPWLGLNDSESGVLIDASVRVRLGDKAKLTLAVEPVAPPFGSVSGVIETYVAPSISMRLAEIGFGIGVGSAIPYTGAIPSYGLLFSPILRIGAEDGLHLRTRTSAVLSSGVATFGSFRAEAQIPLSYGLWLLFAGGVGQNAYGFGDVGLRLLMSGAGSRHSWFAKVLIGGAGATARVGGLQTNEAGPTFGLGIEGRL